MGTKKQEEEIAALRVLAKSMGANCDGLETAIRWSETSGKKTLVQHVAPLAAGVCGAAAASSSAGALAMASAGLLAYDAGRSALSSASAWRRARKENKNVFVAFSQFAKLFAINFKGLVLVQGTLAAAGVAGAGVLAGFGLLKAGQKVPPLKKFSAMVLDRCAEKIEKKFDGFTFEKLEKWGNKLVDFGSRGAELSDKGEIGGMCYRALLKETACMAAAESDSKGFSFAVKAALRPFSVSGCDLYWRPEPGAMSFGELASFCSQVAQKRGFEFADPELSQILRKLGVDSEAQDMASVACEPVEEADPSRSKPRL